MLSIFTWSVLLCLAIAEEPSSNKTLLKYELSQTTKSYNYEKSVVEKDVITSVENAFSITILEDIPILRKGMLQITPNTFYFWMDYNKLFEIEPGVFDNQNITEQIRLERNNLTALKKGTFGNLPVKRIEISYNPITHIEEGAFVNLPNLQSVSLNRNEIADFQPNSFVNTPQLFELGLGVNKLKKIGPRSFTFMKKNTENGIIALMENQIEEIDPKAFEDVSIWRLYLADNKLKSVPEEVFKGGVFRVVELGKNQLESLPDSFFLQENFTEALLSGNRFNCGVQKKLKELHERTKALISYDTENCQ